MEYLQIKQNYSWLFIDVNITSFLCFFYASYLVPLAHILLQKVFAKKTISWAEVKMQCYWWSFLLYNGNFHHMKWTEAKPERILRSILKHHGISTVE